VKKQVSWKWRNWYQNEVDEEIKEVDSRDMMKHTKRNDMGRGGVCRSQTVGEVVWF